MKPITRRKLLSTVLPIAAAFTCEAVAPNAKAVDRCSAACPVCLNTCTLNQGHYGRHECWQGHKWL